MATNISKLVIITVTFISNFAKFKNFNLNLILDHDEFRVS